MIAIIARTGLNEDNHPCPCLSVGKSSVRAPQDEMDVFSDRTVKAACIHGPEFSCPLLSQEKDNGRTLM
jgi:hypothetical protein